MATNTIGDYAELIFTAECVKRGCIVSTPIIQRPNYDCIVETEKGIYKVQIKSTAVKADKYGNYKIRASRKKQGNLFAYYEVGEIDFMAFYIEELNGFFIVPYTEPQLSWRVGLKNKYSIYFDNFAFDFLI